MKQIARRISFVIIFCYIVAASFPIQCYGASDNSIIEPSNENSNNLLKSTDSTTKTDDGTNRETIDKNADKAANDTATEPTKETNSSTEANPKSSSAKSAESEAKDDEPDKSEEDLWYRKQNPMKKEHQKLLWEYCKKRNLSYIDMLALIYTESNFDEKCTTGKFLGYFQISKGNCANLAKTLNTKNEPLNGAVNINWGTAMFSDILADKRVKDLEGKKKRDVALSIYQRGTSGYDKYGINKTFLNAYYKKWDKVNEWFNEKE